MTEITVQGVQVVLMIVGAIIPWAIGIFVIVDDIVGSLIRPILSRAAQFFIKRARASND